jgi:hypothetical protein
MATVQQLAAILYTELWAKNCDWRALQHYDLETQQVLTPPPPTVDYPAEFQLWTDKVYLQRHDLETARPDPPTPPFVVLPDDNYQKYSGWSAFQHYDIETQRPDPPTPPFVYDDEVRQVYPYAQAGLSMLVVLDDFVKAPISPAGATIEDRYHLGRAEDTESGISWSPMLGGRF